MNETIIKELELQNPSHQLIQQRKVQFFGHLRSRDTKSAPNFSTDVYMRCRQTATKQTINLQYERLEKTFNDGMCPMIAVQGVTVNMSLASASSNTDGRTDKGKAKCNAMLNILLMLRNYVFIVQDVLQDEHFKLDESFSNSFIDELSKVSTQFNQAAVYSV